VFTKGTGAIRIVVAPNNMPSGSVIVASCLSAERESLSEWCNKTKKVNWSTVTEIGFASDYFGVSGPGVPPEISYNYAHILVFAESPTMTEFGSPYGNCVIPLASELIARLTIEYKAVYKLQ
jgi:hypothetical protein